jgi:hypothetical protein
MELSHVRRACPVNTEIGVFGVAIADSEISEGIEDVRS